MPPKGTIDDEVKGKKRAGAAPGLSAMNSDSKRDSSAQRGSKRGRVGTTVDVTAAPFENKEAHEVLEYDPAAHVSSRRASIPDSDDDSELKDDASSVAREGLKRARSNKKAVTAIRAALQKKREHCVESRYRAAGGGGGKAKTSERRNVCAWLREHVRTTLTPTTKEELSKYHEVPVTALANQLMTKFPLAKFSLEEATAEIYDSVSHWRKNIPPSYRTNRGGLQEMTPQETFMAEKRGKSWRAKRANGSAVSQEWHRMLMVELTKRMNVLVLQQPPEWTSSLQHVSRIIDVVSKSDVKGADDDDDDDDDDEAPVAAAPPEPAPPHVHTRVCWTSGGGGGQGLVCGHPAQLRSTEGAGEDKEPSDDDPEWDLSVRFSDDDEQPTRPCTPSPRPPRSSSPAASHGARAQSTRSPSPAPILPLAQPRPSMTALAVALSTMTCAPPGPVGDSTPATPPPSHRSSIVAYYAVPDLPTAASPLSASSASSSSSPATPRSTSLSSLSLVPMEINTPPPGPRKAPKRGSRQKSHA